MVALVSYFACGARGARRGSEMPSPTSNVPYAMRTLYKYAQNAHSDKPIVTYHQ